VVRPEIIIGALIGTAFWATCGLFFAVEPSQVKDFAAPIATVLAAGAAAFVAYQLGSGQVAVARTQAEIAERNWRTANEKIVLELFDKRLSIFEEIRAIIGEVTRLGQSPDELLYRYQKAIDRVPYFFGEEVQQFLGAVAGLVGIECGVVSGVINLESSGVEASDWRPRHDEHYHEA
jgi:hypothetical protein